MDSKNKNLFPSKLNDQNQIVKPNNKNTVTGDGPNNVGLISVASKSTERNAEHPVKLYQQFLPKLKRSKYKANLLSPPPFSTYTLSKSRYTNINSNIKIDKQSFTNDCCDKDKDVQGIDKCNKCLTPYNKRLNPIGSNNIYEKKASAPVLPNKRRPQIWKKCNNVSLCEARQSPSWSPISNESANHTAGDYNASHFSETAAQVESSYSILRQSGQSGTMSSSRVSAAQSEPLKPEKKATAKFEKRIFFSNKAVSSDISLFKTNPKRSLTDDALSLGGPSSSRKIAKETSSRSRKQMYSTKSDFSAQSMSSYQIMRRIAPIPKITYTLAPAQKSKKFEPYPFKSYKSENHFIDRHKRIMKSKFFDEDIKRVDVVFTREITPSVERLNQVKRKFSSQYNLANLRPPNYYGRKLREIVFQWKSPHSAKMKRFREAVNKHVQSLKAIPRKLKDIDLEITPIERNKKDLNVVNQLGKSQYTKSLLENVKRSKKFKEELNKTRESFAEKSEKNSQHSQANTSVSTGMTRPSLIDQLP